MVFLGDQSKVVFNNSQHGEAMLLRVVFADDTQPFYWIITADLGTLSHHRNNLASDLI